MNILLFVFIKLEEFEDWDLVDEFLNVVSVIEKKYIDVFYWKKILSGQLVVLFKRFLNEVNVNNYNKILMKVWEVNLDVQFVINVYFCVMYLVFYVFKLEKILGDVLKVISKFLQYFGVK